MIAWLVGNDAGYGANRQWRNFLLKPWCADAFVAHRFPELALRD